MVDAPKPLGPQERRPRASYGRKPKKPMKNLNSPLERNLQATVIRKLKTLRAQDKSFAWRKRHGTSHGTAGDPDLYGLWRGVAWELELKAPGQKPTPLQTERLREWREAGAIAGIVDNAQDADKFFSHLRLRAFLPGLPPAET
jgi:hypothetical protein